MIEPTLQAHTRRARWLLTSFVVLTFAIAFSPAAKVLIVLFPLFSLLLTWYLHKRLHAYYVALVCWLFFLTPMIRRIVEYRSGSANAAALMVAPYAACLVGLGVYRKHWGRIFDNRLQNWVFMLGAIGYASIVGFLFNAKPAMLQDTLAWLSPIFFALYIFSEREHFPDILRGVQNSFVYGCGLMAVYGMYQFFVLAPWDATWMENSALTSIGLPEPQQVRVFSTMNTPQPYADFLIVGILIAFTSKSRLRFAIIPLALLNLGLTMSRSGWLAAVIGVAFLSVTLTSVQRLRFLLGLVLSAILLGMAAQIPSINEVLSTRLQSLTNIQKDGSYNDRVASQDQAISLFEASPFGIGMGGEADKIGDGPSAGKPQPTGIAMGDNGIEQVMLTMGWFASLIYIAGFLSAVIFCIRLRNAPELLPMKAILAGLVLQVPIMGIFAGASGFLIWISLGLCTALYWNREGAGALVGKTKVVGFGPAAPEPMPQLAAQQAPQHATVHAS